MKKKKIIIFIVLGLVATLGLAVAIPFTILGAKTSKLKSDYSYLKEDAEYQEKVEVTGAPMWCRPARRGSL